MAQRKSTSLDLEAVEMTARARMHQAGTAVLASLLTGPEAPPPRVACSCGAEARYYDHRRKQLLTALGPVEFDRAWYLCPQCHNGQCPRDRELGVEGIHYSPAVRRMMAVVGSESSFDQGREQLELLAGIKVTAKAVERQAEAIGAGVEACRQVDIHRARQLELPMVCAPAVPILYIEMDGTGVPVVKAETQGRTGKVDGQPSHSREVKVGCVFTQTGTTEDGRPLRDPDSTSMRARNRWVARCLDWLERGKIEALGKILRDRQPYTEELANTIANEASCFERNAERMRYPAFRLQGLFVGSGVIEAGCKTVIGARLKCSGMFWTVRGANAIIALRCWRLTVRLIAHNYVPHPAFFPWHAPRPPGPRAAERLNVGIAAFVQKYRLAREGICPAK